MWTVSPCRLSDSKIMFAEYKNHMELVARQKRGIKREEEAKIVKKQKDIPSSKLKFDRTLIVMENLITGYQVSR